MTVFDLWHEKNFNYKYLPKKYSLNISDHILCPSLKTKNDLVDIYDIDPKKFLLHILVLNNLVKSLRTLKLKFFINLLFCMLVKEKDIKIL